MSNFPEHEKFNKHFHKLLSMNFQDALKWLYSEGWYFQTEPEAWKSNSALLYQDINTNGIFGHSMDDIHPAEVNYLYFKSLNMKTGVLMRHGRPEYFESNAWPNDVIKDLLGIGGYAAINKRNI